MVYKLVILSFSILLFSCGTRKVDTNKQETISETKTEFYDSSNVSIKYDINTEILTIRPIDSLKPFTYNRNTYFNAVLRKENIKDNSLYRKQNKIVYKQANKVITITKTKYITRTNYSYIYIILILLVLYIIYKLYKKYIL